VRFWLPPSRRFIRMKREPMPDPPFRLRVFTHMLSTSARMPLIPPDSIGTARTTGPLQEPWMKPQVWTAHPAPRTSSGTNTANMGRFLNLDPPGVNVLQPPTGINSSQVLQTHDDRTRILTRLAGFHAQARQVNRNLQCHDTQTRLCHSQLP